MRKIAFRAAAVLALMSTAQLQAAQVAEKPCLTRPEVRGMVAYFLPTVLKSTIDKCTQRLGPKTYLLERAPRLAASLEAGRSEAWPMAKQAFIKLGGEGKKETADLFASLDEELLRPIIEAVISQKLGDEIKPENCGDIDRIMTPLEPLPAANFVEVITEAMTLAGRKNTRFPVCSQA